MSLFTDLAVVLYKSWERRAENQTRGLLGEKREHYLCAMQPTKPVAIITHP